MNILAIDPSLTETGYARSINDHGIIKPPKVVGLGWERISFIRRRVLSLANGVDLVAIEEPFIPHDPKRMGAAKKLIELGAIIRYQLHMKKIPYVDIPPTSLKMYATGRGDGAKVNMIVAARERFQIGDTVNDNECDAYLLWCMAREGCGCPIVKVPQTHLRGMEKVSWPEIGETP